MCEQARYVGQLRTSVPTQSSRHLTVNSETIRRRVGAGHQQGRRARETLRQLRFSSSRLASVSALLFKCLPGTRWRETVKQDLDYWNYSWMSELWPEQPRGDFQAATTGLSTTTAATRSTEPPKEKGSVARIGRPALLGTVGYVVFNYRTKPAALWSSSGVGGAELGPVLVEQWLEPRSDEARRVAVGNEVKVEQPPGTLDKARRLAIRRALLLPTIAGARGTSASFLERPGHRLGTILRFRDGMQPNPPLHCDVLAEVSSGYRLDA